LLRVLAVLGLYATSSLFVIIIIIIIMCTLADEHTATMETGILQLQVRSCGTAFQLNCDKLTLAFNDLSSY